MQQVLIAAAFVAMILAPCVIAMRSGKDLESGE